MKTKHPRLVALVVIAICLFGAGCGTKGSGGEGSSEGGVKTERGVEGNTITLGALTDLTGVFAGSLELATPLALGALCGIVSERSGMFNIAIEGKFLVGACVASVVASVTGFAVGGIIAAMLACVLVGWLLAWLAIEFTVARTLESSTFLFSQVT